MAAMAVAAEQWTVKSGCFTHLDAGANCRSLGAANAGPYAAQNGYFVEDFAFYVDINGSAAQRTT
jgi:hypothetical protein